jgi:hypothetical protein
LKHRSIRHKCRLQFPAPLQEYTRASPVRKGADKSKTLHTFFEAAPGLKELITIGKIWHLGTRGERRRGAGQAYDQVIFDAPSTGHAIPVLNLPSKVLQMARGGAFRSHIEWVEGFLKDPGETVVVVVSAPEEMVVGETLDLIDAVKSIGISVLFTVVNKAYENPFTVNEVETIRDLSGPIKTPAAETLLRIAQSHIERANASDKYIKKLRGGLKDGIIVVPKIFKKDLTPVDLKYIASRCEAKLGGGIWKPRRLVKISDNRLPARDNGKTTITWRSHSRPHRGQENTRPTVDLRGGSLNP